MNARSQSGVTLLEMLVSVAIMGVIASLVYGVFGETLSTSRYVEQRARTFATARAAMDWLERDLRGSFGIDVYESDAPRFISAGHAGEDTLSREAPLLDVTTLTARGTTLLATGATVDAEAEDRGDQARVVYRLEREEFSEDEDGLALARYEFRPPLAEDYERGSRSVVARGIRSIDLRFFDETTDYETWDSTGRSGPRGTAPRVAEIRLVIVEREGEDIEFVSGVTVPFGGKRG